MRSGRKSAAQTPSPKKDQIKGSKVNPKGSASSAKSAKSIELSDSIITTLENKRDEYNKKHPNGKVTLGALKAVFRRGAGAFSSSHRPNMTRSGWAFARVNKFLLKKGGAKVKAAYVQDDDLMERGAILDSIDPYGQLKSLIEEGVVDLKFYETTPEHAKEYGIQANKPLYVQNLIVIDKERLKGIGKKVLHHLDNYANENGNDVIFGYLADKSSFSRDSRQSIYSDIDMIKNWLHNNGYAINNETNEFHKVVKTNNEDGGLIALNGKKSNLTPEQYKLVRTPEFKEWFGDWENDPENSSKVVDENGEPLVVYHGTNSEINEFMPYSIDYYYEYGEPKTEKIFRGDESITEFKNKSKERGWRFIEPNFWFSKNNAYRNTKIQYKCFLKIIHLKKQIDDIVIKRTEKENFGVEIVWSEDTERYYCVFESNQIKLADGSNTTFDANNPDIRYEEGGDLGQEITCVNCGWHWNTNQSDVSDKYVCHKCGFDNRTFYDSDPMSKKYKDGGLLNALNVGMEKLKKNGIVLRSNDGEVTIIAYNTGNQDRKPSLYNKSLIYSSVEPIKSANEIIHKLDSQEFENFSEDNIDDYKSSHFIILNQNEVVYDSENPDIRYEDGGLLKKAPSILKIADKHHVDLETIKNALKDGIKVEMEHTNNKSVAKTIALHHLYESPKYYEKLKIMEKELNLDEHYEDIKKIYAIGGVVDPVLSFSTPTGEPTKLTYLQQVLVRTSAFKNFFGDWEYAGKRFVESGRQEYEYLYRNVSKVIDKITLEPKVVYHGTRVDSEFYVFDVSQQSGDGRPYGYFAHNIEYSQNFTTSSQRSMANAKPFLYKCFVNIRNPFYAMTSEYYDIQEDAQYWKNEISKTIALDKYTNELDSNKLDKIKEVVESQIGKYIDDTFGMSQKSFWLLMARDKNKLFKYFLNNYRYDGIFYAEELDANYFVDNPSEFTEAVTIFEPSQVKLADGRNLNFDPLNVDIRYAKGGDTDNVEKTQKTSNIMGKRENLRNLLLGDKYAEGGEVVANKLKDGNDGKKGGYFEGRSHDDGGIKAFNKDTGQMIEVEGEEVIITKGAVKDPQKREFEGEMLTNREILSRINQSGGGVSFAEGGEMKSSSCGCSGKKYRYGGEMMDDYSIIKIMNRPFEIINDNFADARAFADMLVEKLK